MEKNKFNWGLSSFALVGVLYSFLYYDMKKSVNALFNIEKYMCYTIIPICLIVILTLIADFLSKGKLLGKIKYDFDFLTYDLITILFCIFYFLIEKEKGDLPLIKIIIIFAVLAFCLWNTIYNVFKAKNS